MVDVHATAEMLETLAVPVIGLVAIPLCLLGSIALFIHTAVAAAFFLPLPVLFGLETGVGGDVAAAGLADAEAVAPESRHVANAALSSPS